MIASSFVGSRNFFVFGPHRFKKFQKTTLKEPQKTVHLADPEAHRRFLTTFPLPRNYAFFLPKNQLQATNGTALRPVVSAPSQGPNSQAVPHAAKPPRFPIQKRGHFGRHDFSRFPRPQNPRPFEPPKKLADEPHQGGSGKRFSSFLDRSCDRHGSGSEFPLARKGHSP